MKGYAGWILRVDLSNGKISKEPTGELKKKFLGGRGFAAKLLWDEVRDVDPLSSDNRLIFAVGPLTGISLPSSGKLVVASKSPLTDGYGDGNIGTFAAVHLRKAGYDVLILEGRASKPSYLKIENEDVEILDATDLWGLDTFKAQDKLEEWHGKGIGVVLIGPAGENLVKYATLISQKGRAGGRPGMGAVMGSKNLKAIVIRGTKEISVHDKKKLRELGIEGYRDVKGKENYDFWIRQGTMMVFEWCNENSCLPVYNFREGIFEHSKKLDGYMLEEMKTDRKGCPMCNMRCGNVVKDLNGRDSELDYENVGMLGPNLGMDHLNKVAVLNRMADEEGLDTISLGSSIAFLMEASEKKLIEERIEWGDFEMVKGLIEDIAYRRGLGELASEGVKKMAERIGGDSLKFAMHVKGLETSAYNCHVCPGMALAFATSPIGAHHKDAWVISWEISTDRFSYDESKVNKVIEFQRIRGGMFESLTTCRLPWIEVGFDLDWYPKYLEAVTGEKTSLTEIFTTADRIYSLIRAFWVRELGDWGREMDYPPKRWFLESMSQGNLKGLKLDRKRYDEMLSMYYKKRGWNKDGIPTRKTLEGLGLHDVAEELFKIT